MKKSFGRKNKFYVTSAVLALTLTTLISLVGCGDAAPNNPFPQIGGANYGLNGAYGYGINGSIMGCPTGTLPIGGSQLNPYNYSAGYGSPGFGYNQYQPFNGGYYPAGYSPNYYNSYGGNSGYTNGCVPTAQIFQGCYYYGGIQATVNGVTVCRQQVNLAVNIQPQPLTSAVSQGGYTAVIPNDTITFSADAASSYCLKYSGFNCNDYTIDGIRTSDQSLTTNGTLAAGLVGTDGSELFLVGSNSSKVMTHNGYLSLGINSSQTLYGVKLVNPKLQLTRCIGASGQTYQCN